MNNNIEMKNKWRNLFFNSLLTLIYVESCCIAYYY
jgi:hypothetical protein